MLQQRIHPAESRVRMLAERVPAHFVAFDLLALESDDYTRWPFSKAARVARAGAEEGGRRSTSPRRRPTSGSRSSGSTSSRSRARRRGRQAAREGTYQPDKRVMFKIKHTERTADCVVAGYRLHKSGPDAVGSLLLGLYDDEGQLSNVGVIGAFPMERRRALLKELEPLVTTFDGHPWNWRSSRRGRPGTPGARRGNRWNSKKDLSFVPLRPERVVEVRFDHMEGDRFRHTAQFVRWRPDRDPRSCTFEQLEGGELRPGRDPGRQSPVGNIPGRRATSPRLALGLEPARGRRRSCRGRSSPRRSPGARRSTRSGRASAARRAGRSGVPAARPQLDQVHRLARVHLHHEPDPVGHRDGVLGDVGTGVLEHDRPRRRRVLHHAVHSSRHAGVSDHLGVSNPCVGESACHSSVRSRWRWRSRNAP